MPATLFDTEFLKKLETLNLLARHLVHGRRQAIRPSVKKGASIEFRDFREYSPGDDPRSVDWMAYARLGELFVKLYRQEEELDLWVLLDCSGSMDFGGTGGGGGAVAANKFDHARRIAAALAYIGMANMDSASIMPFDADLRPAPPGLERMRGKGKIFRVLDFLSGLRSGEKTDLRRAAQSFVSRARRPGLVVILSDFYGLEGAQAALDRIRFLKHQVHVIQLVCPWERDPPIRGELRLVDVESGGHEDLTITDSMLRRYKAAFAQFSDSLRAYAMRCSIGYDQAHTDIPFDQFVRDLLQHGGLLA